MRNERNWNWKARVLSFAMALLMVLSVVPVQALQARAVTDASRTADASTIDGWKTFFAADNTEYAGGVWTDKSVFTPTEANKEFGDGTITNTGDNFLVALSAIASNKTITGYSNIPTDTMLILDVSGSMNDDRGNNGCWDEMVRAANLAIEDLQNLNKNNRVGVVLYSGNPSTGNSNMNHATLLLPLGRYTTSETDSYRDGENNVEYPVYLTAGNQQVSVNRSNVSYEGGGRVNAASKSVAGGTYIQAGIKKAMDAFLGAEPVVQDGIQAGTVRMPIMVLMSDGAPTAGTNSFTNPGTSNMGDGQNANTSEAIGFVTQLTASYAKYMVEDHYGRDAMFYTLGLGLDSVGNGKADMAKSVMDPANSTATINTYWTRFNQINLGDASESNDYITITHSNNNQKKVYGIEDSNGSQIALEKNYVDEFVNAKATANTTLEQALLNAFAAIVDEIILQSKYYPTYIDTGDHEHDGYITFADRIGEYMEVTAIKDIQFDGKMYTGAQFASAVTNESFWGTVENPTDAGDNLIWSIKQRLGIADTATARVLVDNAFNKGQIGNSEGGYSNYIGWYSDASGNYVDFWYEGIPTAVPEGATHIVKSYMFLGEITGQNTDMLYISVRVSHNIVSGEEMVTWQIPASLIPTVTYEVSLDGATHDSALKTLTSNADTAKPIRLLYEVALREDLHDWNIAEETGNTTTFYTNKWAAWGEGEAPSTSSNTYSHFEPSVDNERYYYTYDTPILQSENSTDVVYGDTKPTGGTYYRAYYVYGSHEGGEQETHVHYEPISAESLTKAESRTDANGNTYWVIPKGTIHRYLDNFYVEKGSGNYTGTVDYVDYPWISSMAGKLYTMSIQGNNGKLTVTPATGIKLTKTLVEEESGSFTFTISGESGDPVLIRLDENGNEAGREDIAFGAAFTVDAGETVYIIGLTAGAQYTITEANHADYAVQKVVVNGVQQTGDDAVITAVGQTIVPAEFTNAPKGQGNLYITKEVLHTHDGEAFPTDKVFELKVTLTGNTDDFTLEHTTSDGSTKEDLTEGEHYTLNADKTVISGLKIKHGESIKIVGLTEGTVAVVEELLTTEQTANFTAGYESVDVSGAAVEDDGDVTIGHNVDSAVKVINIYKPTDLTGVTVNVSGRKSVTGAWNNSATFNFKVQQYVNGGWQDLAGAVGSVAMNGSSDATSATVINGTFAIDNVLNGIEFTQAGEYAYQVVEVIPDEANKAEGITYDRTTHTFTVHVVDVNGKLTVSKIVDHDGNNLTVTDGVWTVEPEFKNYYDSTYVVIDVEKSVIDNSKDTPILSGYQFALYDATVEVDKETKIPTWIRGNEYVTETSDAAGEARFVKLYNDSDIGKHYYILEEVDGDAAGVTYDPTVYYIVVDVAEDENGKLTATISQYTPGDTMTLAEEEAEEETDPTDPSEDESEPTDPSEDESEPTDPSEGESEPTDPSEDESEPTDPTEGESEPTDPSEGESEPTDPSEGESESTDPSEGESEPTDPSEDESEPTDPSEDESEPTDPSEDESEPTDPSEGESEPTDPSEGSNPPPSSASAPLAETGVTYTNMAVFAFQNTYDPADTTVSLNSVVQKSLEGRDLVAGEFTFSVIDTKNTEDSSDDTVAASGTNAADGTVTFNNNLSFSRVGTYYYKIYEVKGDLGGVTYDSKIYDMVVEVVDNNGALSASYYFVDELTNHITFKNTYDAADTSIAIQGTKTLTGRRMVNAEFTFQLTGVDENDNEIVLKAYNDPDSDGDGSTSFTFPEITYTKEGIYEYTVTEVAGQNNLGLTYDSTVYTVTVSVTDNGEGQLVATQSSSEPVVFNNSYKAKETSMQFFAEKILEGRTLVDGEFTFGLYKSAAIPEGATALSQIVCGDEIATARNSDDGTFAFSEQKYSSAGTRYYLIKEVIPTETSNNGITYDSTWYHITVDVVDNLSGKLVADVTEIVQISTDYQGNLILNNNVNQVVFVNSYRVVETAQASVTINATKFLENCAGLDEEFAFVVKEGEIEVARATVSDLTDGEHAFVLTIPYDTGDIGTHDYTITEVIGANDGVTYDDTVYDLQVIVADNNSGGLKIGQVTVKNGEGTLYFFENGTESSHSVPAVNAMGDNVVSFVNTYSVKEGATAAVTIHAAKELTGKDLTAGEFSFTIQQVEYKNNTWAAVEGGYIATMQNGVGENAAVGALKHVLSYSTPGIYHYLITEAEGNNAGIVYDDTTYRITVTVADNGQGGLKVQQVIVRRGANVIHSLTGGTESSYEIPAVSGEGENAVDLILFENEYRIVRNAKLTINGSKAMEGRTLTEGEFTFKIQEVDQNGVPVNNGYTNSVVNGKVQEGNTAEFSFQIEYEPESLGEHYYQVTEAVGSDSSVAYDKTVYTVKVVVADDLNGGLKISEITVTDAAKNELCKPEDISGLGTANATVPASVVAGDTETTETKFITFKNTYTVLEDADALLTINGTKTLTGKAMEENEFVFQLTETDKDGNALNDGVTKTISNGAVQDSASGFAFAIAYAKKDIGTHYYTVTEKAGTNAGIAYDKAEYKLVVTVADDTKGGLKITEASVNGKTDAATGLDTKTVTIPADAVTFENTYAIVDGAEVSFQINGTKTLIGRDMEAGEFTFNLTETSGSGTAISAGYTDTAINAAAGNGRASVFAFDAITVDEAGTYYYVITEAVGSDANVTYDRTLYLVMVEVVDNLAGGLMVESIVISDGKTTDTIKDSVVDASRITFANIYLEPPKIEDIEVDVNVEKTVKNKGSKKAGLDGFEFLMTNKDDKDDVYKAKSDKKGNATFSLTFTEEDAGKTFTYVITEKDQGKKYMTYSDKSYTVKITVELNETTGKLEATVKSGWKTIKNGDSVGEFVNTYDYPDAENANTGDQSNVGMWICILGASAAAVVLLLILGRKGKKGKGKYTK